MSPVVLNSQSRNSHSEIPGLSVGITVPGQPTFDLSAIKYVSVTNNNFYEADTWELAAVLSGQKAPYKSPVWWGNQGLIEARIKASYDKGLPTELIVGVVDDLDIRLRDDLLILSGRDYTERFIDTRLSDTFLSVQNGKIFLNQTASQIVEQLLSEYFPTMAYDVVQTTTVIGTQAATQNALMFRNRSLWDVITWLAQNESGTDPNGNPVPFVAYVKGRTLYFGPMTAGGLFDIRWNPISEAVTLNVSRNLSLANDIRVTVQGFGPLGRYQAVASGKHAAAPSTDFPKGYQHYVYTINGLTQQQASNRATSLALSLSQHELVCRVGMPADFTLDPYGQVRIREIDASGKVTVWDTNYWINAVTWKFSLDKGANMDLWLKNHPVGQQVTL